MLIGFEDKKGYTLHSGFQKWRQSNSEGYFLACRTRKRTFLHVSECHQTGGAFWDGVEYRDGLEVKVSLTRHRKVCSDNQVEILSWAEVNSIAVNPCTRCILGPLAERKLKKIDYREEIPQIRMLLRKQESKTPIETGRIFEGIIREITTKKRSRSARLRQAALDQAEGVCEACRTDFSRVLNGLGVKVLQAHHRKQLSLVDEPILNGTDDLAVVCANCHALIHSNVKSSLEVEELRRRLLE